MQQQMGSDCGTHEDYIEISSLHGGTLPKIPGRKILKLTS